MQNLDSLRLGQTVEEILQADLDSEIEARALYLEAAAYCDSVNDRVSKLLFEELATAEEEHIDFLETQFELIKQVGFPLYAQKHIGGLEG
jgi:bacterioferritin